MVTMTIRLRSRPFEDDANVADDFHADGDRAANGGIGAGDGKIAGFMHAMALSVVQRRRLAPLAIGRPRRGQALAALSLCSFQERACGPRRATRARGLGRLRVQVHVWVGA